jgi:hypothetical protein
MSKKPRWVVALLAGATLAVPASAQVVRREGRAPLVVDRPASVAAGPLISLEGPLPGQTVSGVVTVSGFVLDVNAVDKIELFIDDSTDAVNRAVLNLPRPEIVSAFPAYAPSNPAPGWMTSFLARNYLDGPHDLYLAVTESGQAGPWYYGPITVDVDNTINQPPFGEINVPGSSATFAASGPLSVLGWALDDSDIDHIDFLVDGSIMATAIGRGGVGNASYGSTRPDIYAAFPDFPGPLPASLYSGFLANIDTTQFLNGMHTVSVNAYDNQGASREIGSVEIQVMNNGGLLVPFGAIDLPLDEATLICGPSVPVIPPGGPCPSPCFPGGGGGVPVSFFPNTVKGWALDTGARLDAGQVSYVELMLDGALLANTRSQCTVSGNIFANCYGLSRPDIAHQYQGFVNSANAGFQFTFGLSRDASLGLLDIIIPTPFGTVLAGYTLPGKHTLSVRVGDEENSVTEFGAMSVNITCDASSNPDRASFGDVDAPTQDQFINGTFQVFGWVYDMDGAVSSLDLAIDGYVIANLNPVAGTYGIRRDDVPVEDYRVLSPFVGFAYALDTTALGDSQHDLTIYANSGSRRTLIGRRQFVAYNNTANKQ